MLTTVAWPAVALAQAIPPSESPAEPAPAPVVMINPGATRPDVEPPMIVADDHDDVADGWNLARFSTGALVFVGSYGVSTIVAASNDHRGDRKLYVPVAGPWLALGDRSGCDLAIETCDHETTAKVMLVVDGVLQIAGLAIMVDSLVQPSHHRHYRHVARREYHLAPTSFGRGEPGVAFAGRF